MVKTQKMNMPLSFRQCTPDDLETLREFSIRNFRETFGDACAPEDMDAYLTEAFGADKLAAELRDPASFFGFLYSGDELAGYLKVNEADAQSDIHDASSLEIQRIYVTKKFQGEGLGAHLMGVALDLARARGKSYVWLGVWEKNTSAIGFYENAGFRKAGTHSFTIGDDVQTDFIMRKDL